jgi:hypothetical protein
MSHLGSVFIPFIQSFFLNFIKKEYLCLTYIFCSGVSLLVKHFLTLFLLPLSLLLPLDALSPVHESSFMFNASLCAFILMSTVPVMRKSFFRLFYSVLSISLARGYSMRAQGVYR